MDSVSLVALDTLVVLDSLEILDEVTLITEQMSYAVVYQDSLVTQLMRDKRTGYMRGEHLVDGFRVQVYASNSQQVAKREAAELQQLIENQIETQGRNACAVWRFADGTQQVNLRYGISFISAEQAKKNLYREQTDYNVTTLASKGREIWNQALSRINVEGATEDEKTILYSSYYRTFERPICMSEDGRYFSAFDGQVHEDNGIPFYTDDWI